MPSLTVRIRVLGVVQAETGQPSAWGTLKRALVQITRRRFLTYLIRSGHCCRKLVLINAIARCAGPLCMSTCLQ